MAELESQTDNIEEQCVRLKENTSQMREISKDLQQVTKPIASIEETLDDAAKKMGDMTDDPFYRMQKNEFAKHITNAIAAHENWLGNLQKMVESQMIIPLQSNAAKCGFGHFYYSMTPKNPEIKEIWIGIGDKHKKFHQYGSDVVDAIMSGNYTKAQSLYEEVDRYSDELLADLKKMKAIAEA